MTKPRKTRNAAATVQVPQNREQLAAAIREIGEHQRQLARLQAAMNDELAQIKERWEAAAQTHSQRVTTLTQGVQIWSEAHRDALTQGGKTKTVTFPTGEIAWRLRPPSVRITGAEAVLDALRRLGLSRFIRAKEEINKEAILNEPAAVTQIPGISISQGEDFLVQPFEAPLNAPGHSPGP